MKWIKRFIFKPVLETLTYTIDVLLNQNVNYFSFHHTLDVTRFLLSNFELTVEPNIP